MHPGFKKRVEWFLENRPDLTAGLASITEMRNEQAASAFGSEPRTPRADLEPPVRRGRVSVALRGSLACRASMQTKPYTLSLDGRNFEVAYEPAESQTDMFGGNSNWRGPGLVSDELL